MILIFLFSGLAESRRRDEQQRLLDYLLDNYQTFSNPNIRDYVNYCPNFQRSTGINAHYCAVTFNNYRSLLSNLAELLSDVRNESVSQERAWEVISCLPPALPNFSDLEGILQRLDAKEDCRPLNPGEFKVSDFLLSRNEDGNYEATVNVNFEYVSGSVSADDMRLKVNQCLRNFTPYLRSPSGETLNIRVFSPSEIQNSIPLGQRPPVINVKLHEGERRDENGNLTYSFRANSRNYPDSIPCPTILHESLHHLGLCDEYREESTEITSHSNLPMHEAYGCRVVPRLITVMASQFRAIQQVVPQRIICECTNDACRRTLTGTSADDRYIREMMTLEEANSFLPEAVKRRCRPGYLDPRIYDLERPGSMSVILSQTPSSVVFESRSYQPGPPLPTGTTMVMMRDKLTCNCEDDQECLRALPEAIEKLQRNNPGNSCPDFMRKVSETYLPAGDHGAHIFRENTLELFTTPSRGGSLLMPNHFNRILYKDCETGPVADYNRCASFSQTALSDPLCAQRPETCLDDRVFLGGHPP